ncbi:MAG: zinc ribbon domain-containing protein [Kofleriaceae bacterium]|nr:zinc ribbon domain-containing protein [Myxococcales bacterium]MCB9574012.1 zinc ribbon domain-containing protein [Kofleriaceae bacterium]
MSDDKRFQMLWDCSFCGASRLLAVTHRHCPECGGAQDQTKRYFPADGEKVEVVDAYEGTDRACPNCKHANGAKAKHCASCGAPLDDAAAVATRQDQVAKTAAGFGADDAKRAEAELTGKPKAAPIKKRGPWRLISILVVIGMAVFAIWFMCIRKRSAEMEVTAQRWQRVIPIEEYREVEEEDWQDHLPTSARTLSCRDKQFDSRKVPDGEDCQVRRVDKGDGTFQEKKECTPKYKSEPINKPWCRYAIYRWTQIDEKSAQGDGAGERTWPDTGVKPGPQVPGARREGTRKETFVIELKEAKGGKTHRCDVGEATWKKLPAGTAVKAEVRARSGEIVCSTLSAK